VIENGLILLRRELVLLKVFKELLLDEVEVEDDLDEVREEAIANKHRVVK
jgi:hypothetical protein